MTLWRTVGCSAVFYKKTKTKLRTVLGYNKKETSLHSNCVPITLGRTAQTDICTSEHYIIWIKSSFWYPNFYPFDVLFVNWLCYVMTNRTTQAGWKDLLSDKSELFLIFLFFNGSHDQATKDLSWYISNPHPEFVQGHSTFVSTIPRASCRKTKQKKQKNSI